MESKHDRIVKTHLPLRYWKNQLDNQPSVKVIQILRNPKDLLVSYYKYYCIYKAFGPFSGSWDDFFELFKNKQLVNGDYFDHQVDWFRYNKSRENSLIIFYEDMKNDLKGHVRKFAKFLNKNISEKVLSLITKRTTFSSMRTDPKLRIGSSLLEGEFMANGKVGSWRDYFSDEQSADIDAKCSNVVQDVGLEFKFN